MRQGRDVDGLQVGVLDGGVELGWVLVFGLEAIGDGAAHGFFPHGERLPGVARLPVTGMKQRIGRVELALEGQDGSSFQRGGGHDGHSMSSVQRVWL